MKQAHPAELPDTSVLEELAQTENALRLEGSAFINTSGITIAESEDDFAGFVLIEKDSLLNTASPVGDAEPLRNGLLQYRVDEGDSISTIAAKYGISVNTIIWANNIKDTSLIKPDQDIVILPVSGILHEVGSGETLDSIAAAYGVELGEIKTFNDDALREGDTVIVPHAKPKTTSVAYSGSSLPSASGYFARPVAGGLNWGNLHDGNAVDISEACGSPILAAADGVVVSTGSPLFFSSGYGGYVKLEHGNGTGTFYAHTSENTVSVGDFASQGDTIAKIGRTGRVSGSTGCHVHFGVTGAQNPFAK